VWHVIAFTAVHSFASFMLSNKNNKPHELHFRLVGFVLGNKHSVLLVSAIEVEAVAVRTAAEFELVMVLSVIAAVFWDMTPCDLVQVCRSATGTLFLLRRYMTQ